MQKKAKQYSAEEKTKIVLETLREEGNAFILQIDELEGDTFNKSANNFIMDID